MAGPYTWVHLTASGHTHASVAAAPTAPVVIVFGAEVFGALTVNLRLRELMLPVLIYPLLIPLLIAAIELTNGILLNQPPGSSTYLWGRVLVVFDAIFTSLAIALAEIILVN